MFNWGTYYSIACVALLSFIGVNNMQTESYFYQIGCPPLIETLSKGLDINEAILTRMCQKEYVSVEPDDSSGSGDDEEPTLYLSVCKFDCNAVFSHCQQLANKIHYTLVYEYNVVRWRVSDIVSLCRNWDEYYYKPTPAEPAIVVPTTDTGSQPASIGLSILLLGMLFVSLGATFYFSFRKHPVPATYQQP